MTALSDYVLLKEVENEDSIGTILIADTKQAPIRADVIAVGDKVVNVHVGDLVLFNRGMTTPATIKGEDYLILKEADIFLTL